MLQFTSMVSPQLLDYIRQQFAAGVSKEEISKALLINNWQPADINEAFANLVNPAPTYQPPTPISQNLVTNKSVWYRILRVAIVVLGVVSLLAVASLFIIARLGVGEGWVALILVFILSPYIEGAVIFCVVLFLLYCLLYFLRWKKEGYAFGKIVLIIGILAILPTGAQIYSSIVIHNAQTSSDKANPIVTGTQPYDFSKDVVFHTGKLSFLGDMQMHDNVIVWPEFTKQSPPYSRDVTDLFVFAFSPADSKGTVAQATHFDKSVNDLPYTTFDKAYIIGGKLYWFEGYAGGASQKDLVMYDPLAGVQTTLLKEEKTPIFLEGGYGDNLMLARGITKPNGYSGYAVSLFNVSTKSEFPLDEYAAEATIFGNGYFCHATKNNNIGIYNIEKKEELIIKTPATDRELGYGMGISGCSQSYVIYTFAPASVPGTPAVWETHILTLKNDGSTVDKPLVIQNVDLKSSKLVLVNNYLFYSVANVIYRKDLSTGNETQILSSDGLGKWDTDGNYLAYELAAGQDTAFHIKKIDP